MNGRVIILLIGLIGIAWQLAGCAIKNEELHIVDSLIIVKMENNKPKVRVASGFDECKWRGKVHFESEDYEIWLKCKIPLNL